MEDLRFYSTIGIEGFLSGPPHPLPETYLLGRHSKGDGGDRHGGGGGDDGVNSTNKGFGGDDEEGNNTDTGSFCSWEMTGTIKHTPQDFIVREVLPKDKIIPGLSKEDIGRIRVADLLRTEYIPRQHNVENERRASNNQSWSEMQHHKETISMNSTDSSSQTIPPDDIFKETTLREVIEKYLDVVATKECSSKQLMQSLEQLHDRAIDRIQTLATPRQLLCDEQQVTNVVETDDQPDGLWIPPPATKEMEIVMRGERGTFHRAIRVLYPFLKTEGRPRPKSSMSSSTENASDDGEKLSDLPHATPTNEHWIVVTIDDSFDDLIGYLYDPIEDLRNFLLFRNRGFEGARRQASESTHKSTSDNGHSINVQHPVSATSTSNHRDGRISNHLSSDDSSCTILRLRPGLSKDDRRKVHQLIASKNKHLATSTTQIVLPSQHNETNSAQSNDGASSNTSVTGITVTWQKQSLMREENKKKRKWGVNERGSRSNDHPSCRTTSNNDNLLCVLQKDEKEHLTAVQKLTQILRCRQSDIGFAGIKDMKAITYQFITLRNMRRRRVEAANQQLLKQGLKLGLFYHVDFILNVGDLEGNQFEINVRNIKRIRVDQETVDSPAREGFVACQKVHVARMVQRIQQHGFINFYGEQRIGAPGSEDQVGVRAFDVGKAMLQKKYNRAIDLLMTGTTHRETEQVRHVRHVWKESGGDPAATLKAFQGSDILPREKALLRGLNRYVDNPLEAIRCLSHSMRIFYVNAYQSYIWNQAASHRIRLYGDKVVKGDLYSDNDNVDKGDVRLVESDDSAVNISQIVLPLPGYNVQYPENEIGELYQKLLRADNVTFQKDAVVESTAKGSYRKLVAYPTQLTYDMDTLDETGVCSNLKLSFQIPKGSYATMLLRELMLTTATRSSQHQRRMLQFLARR